MIDYLLSGGVTSILLPSMPANLGRREGVVAHDLPMSCAFNKPREDLPM